MGKVLIICRGCHSKYNGNLTTSERIRRHLETTVECDICEPKEFAVRSNNNCVGIVAIHAYHSASALKGCKLPYIIIFGGTDLNEYSQKDEYLDAMSEVVKEAWKLIVFGPSMKRKVYDIWPDLCRNKVLEIPQAVETSVSDFNLKKYIEDKFNILASKMFLLVLGIRPVKDPLFLTSDFEGWHNEHEDCWLIIIGSKMDDEYYAYVKETLRRMDGIILLTDVPRCDVHSAMKDSEAVVNCSLSEGMCSSVLEAMNLEVPVIARNIPGNRDLIQDRVTGLLYQTTKEFLEAIELILNCRELRQELVKNAKLQIIQNHQCEKEAAIYNSLVNSMLSHNSVSILCKEVSRVILCE